MNKGVTILGKVNYSLNIVAPVDKCFNLLKDSLNDSRYIKATASLYSKSSNLTMIIGDNNTFITIREKGFDPLTKMNYGGWDTTFSFIPVTRDVTQVDITVEYSFFTAFLGLGLMKTQAKAQILSFVNSLITLEKSLNSQRPIV